MFFVYKEISNVYKNDFYNSLLNFSREIDQALDLSLLLQTSLQEEIVSQERKIFPFSLRDSFVVVSNEGGRVLAFNGTEKIPNLLRGLSAEEFEQMKLLGPGSYSIERVKVEGQKRYLYQVNYFSQNRFGHKYLIQVLVSSSFLQEDTSRLMAKLVLWLPLLGGFILVATYLLFRVSLVPIHRLNRQIETAELHHFSQNLLVGKGLPEVLRRFIQNINNLIQRLNANIKDQELFIAYASHQIKTPLTLISGLSQQLKAKIGTSEEQEETATDIIMASKDLSSILDKLMLIMSLNDNKRFQLQEVDLLDLVTSVIDEFEDLLVAKGLDFDMQANDEFEYLVQTEVDLIKMMMSNLIHNAIKYSKPNTQVKIKFDTRFYKDGERYYIEIQNTSEKIDESEFKNMKQAFYRSSNSAGIDGSGLGLSIVERISVLLDTPYEIAPSEYGFRAQIWVKK